MALLVSRFLTIGPRIWKENGKLYASTGWRLWLLTLGLINRMVVIDPKKQRVQLRDRWCWFFDRKKTYRFAAIRAVGYGYSDAMSFGGLNYVRDSIDLYSVGLILHGDHDNYRHLFRFAGEGSFVNDGPFPDWFYWEDYLFDAEGTQGEDSKLFVELLQKMLGVGIEPL